MNVFHSGTDNDDLQENSEFYPYYLSVIVNNKQEWDVKIGVRGTKTVEESPYKKKVIYSQRGDNSVIKTGPSVIETTEAKVTTLDVVFVYDGEIFLEEDNKPSEAFIARVAVINRPAPVTNYQSFGNSYTQYNSQTSSKKNIVNAINQNIAADIVGKALNENFPSWYMAITFFNAIANPMDRLEACKLIEDEFDKRYLNTVSPYTYPEYLESFLAKLTDMAYLKEYVDDLIKYFTKVLDENRPTAALVVKNHMNLTEEELSKLLSLGTEETFAELKEYYKNIFGGSQASEAKRKYVDKLIQFNQSYTNQELYKLFWEFYGKATGIYSLNDVATLILGYKREEKVPARDEDLRDALSAYAQQSAEIYD